MSVHDFGPHPTGTNNNCALLLRRNATRPNCTMARSPLLQRLGPRRGSRRRGRSRLPLRPLQRTLVLVASQLFQASLDDSVDLVGLHRPESLLGAARPPSSTPKLVGKVRTKKIFPAFRRVGQTPVPVSRAITPALTTAPTYPSPPATRPGSTTAAVRRGGSEPEAIFEVAEVVSRCKNFADGVPTVAVAHASLRSA